MKLSFSKVILIGTVLVALFLRVWHLGTNPPSLSWDEVSIGYNAYSILKTGKDEHGKFFPLDAFAAFGDYKPPVPVYLTLPFVALMGPNEWAVRLPSAIAGTLTVLVSYFLAATLFKKSAYKEWIAQFTAVLFAITPWHIMLSRAGFEANIALLFIMCGVWLALKAREDPRYYVFCWLPFVAGLYTFNSARYAGPLIAAGVAVAGIAAIKRSVRQVGLGIIIALIALLPTAHHLVSKEARLRFDEVSIFTDLRTVLTSNMRRQVDGFTWWSNIFHNRRLGYGREYLIHFFDNLEPRFLFVRGDGNPKFSIQDTGQLLLVSAPFIVYGAFSVFRDEPTIAWLLLWWLVAAIAPAAVARETPHALRIENGLPVFLITTAYGLASVLTMIKRVRIRTLFFVVFFLLFAGNFFYFWHNLVAHYPKEYSGEWQYGYKDAVRFIEKVQDRYDTVVLTESIGRPYIYVLFYEAYDPRNFWSTKDASFDAAGFYNVYGFDKYRFTREGVGGYTGKTLYILSPKDVPAGAHVLETFRLLDGHPVLVAFE